MALFVSALLVIIFEKLCSAIELQAIVGLIKQIGVCNDSRVKDSQFHVLISRFH